MRDSVKEHPSIDLLKMSLHASWKQAFGKYDFVAVYILCCSDSRRGPLAEMETEVARPYR